MLVKLEAYHDGEDVFTQRESLDELMSDVKEAVSLHLEGRLLPGEALRVLLMSERKAE